MSKCLQNEKNTCQNGSKINKNVPKCHLFDSIRLKKGICFLCETNRLACFDPIVVPEADTGFVKLQEVKIVAATNNKQNNFFIKKIDY